MWGVKNKCCTFRRTILPRKRPKIRENMMSELKKTKQCVNCPWRVESQPQNIPNGYTIDNHLDLSCTIANSENPINDYLDHLQSGVLHVMVCHQTVDAYCIGWLMNQLGNGNNIALRINTINIKNIYDVKLIGEQHKTFEDTVAFRKLLS